MNLSIRERVRRSVVHVICGDTEGTAFFVTNDTLLTAYHNIVDSICNSDIPVEIVVEGEMYSCEIIPLGNQGERIDVAILKCRTAFDAELSGLNLLAYMPNQERELITMGYPMELCNCVAPFQLPLKFIESINNSDTDLILVKTSDVSFFSWGSSKLPWLSLAKQHTHSVAI